ncbi:MAG: indolepyruvate oxidoreductase subunit beta [Desulfobacterales bacterium]|jgi:indolepyruvate ferredoxin oxidoreductase beta subunit
MTTKRIMIVAVGGQGNILAARVLGESAAASGITPRMSEFHDMAQRGGVVESMVLLGEGRGYCIADGQADVLLGFEPSETIHAAKKCGAHSVVITNTAPQPPFTVAMGQTQYPQIKSTMQLLAGRVKKLIAFDAASLAARAGSSLSLNMVMLGALARSEATGISPEMFRGVARTKTKSAFTDINLKAFDLGMSAID